MATVKTDKGKNITGRAKFLTACFFYVLYPLLLSWSTYTYLELWVGISGLKGAAWTVNISNFICFW
jgi:energy-converting hydrogenase Eha subunit G